MLAEPLSHQVKHLKYPQCEDTRIFIQKLHDFWISVGYRCNGNAKPRSCPVTAPEKYQNNFQYQSSNLNDAILKEDKIHARKGKSNILAALRFKKRR